MTTQLPEDLLIKALKEIRDHEPYHHSHTMKDIARVAIGAYSARTAPEPVAWMHTMHMELGQTITHASLNEDHEWGEPGVNYSAEYEIVSTPLYASRAAPPLSDEAVEKMARALAKDSDAQINERWDKTGRTGLDFTRMARAAIAALGGEG